MTVTCGDDLVAARRFTNLCQSHMSEIFSGGEMPFSDILMRLGDIQSQAKFMHARAIYKSAQRVVDDLTRRQSVSACANSVLSLQNLIAQYEAGLSEIAPKKAKMPEAKAANNAGPAIISELAKQSSAAETLQPLVKYASASDQKNLVRLIGLAANDRLGKNAKADRKFDDIMPALTNGWLRLARAQDKSISVSVASSDTCFNLAMLRILQKNLQTIGATLVTRCVEAPDARSGKALSRSAHLAVTVQKRDTTADILVSCEGRLPAEFQTSAFGQDLIALGAQLSIGESGGIVRFEMTRVPVSVVQNPINVLQEIAS